MDKHIVFLENSMIRLINSLDLRGLSELRRWSSTSRIASLYKYLWSIPLPGHLLGLAAVMSTICLFSMIFIGGLVEKLLFTALGIYAPLLINCVVSRLRIGLLNLRRLNQITIVTMVFITFSLLLLLAPLGIFLSPIIMGLGIFIRTIVTLTLAEKDHRKIIPPLITMMLCELLPPVTLSQNHLLKSTLISSYSMGFLSALLLFLILSQSYVRGISLMRYLTATLALILNGKRKSLEEVAESFDDESEIGVDLLIFKRRDSSRPELVVVIPGFHPGPFRDFGSSGLPYLIADELSKNGVDVIFFKGLSGHSNNIISMEDCRRIAEKIAEVVKDSWRLTFKSCVGLPIALHSGMAKASLITLGDSKLLFLTLHPNGMEDIPPSILNDIEDENLVVIDCHNSFSDNIKELEGTSILRLREIVEVASNMRQVSEEELNVGYSWIRPPPYTFEEGIGPLGISALTICSDKRLMIIIALDGNNALPVVREEIMKRLKELDFQTIEVLTTDTHIVNGLKLGGRGYHPLGEVISPKNLAEDAFKAASAALRNLKPMEVSRVKLTFDGVKVMSERFLSEAEKMTMKGLRLFILFAIAAPLLSTILTLLA